MSLTTIIDIITTILLTIAVIMLTSMLMIRQGWVTIDFRGKNEDSPPSDEFFLSQKHTLILIGIIFALTLSLIFTRYLIYGNSW
jgi:hypothetical protein